MNKPTQARPRLRDRLTAAWRTFKDPNGAYLKPYLDGMRDYPRLTTDLPDLTTASR